MNLKDGCTSCDTQEEHGGKRTREGTNREVKTKETRKWGEGPSGEVGGNGFLWIGHSPHDEDSRRGSE